MPSLACLLSSLLLSLFFFAAAEPTWGLVNRKRELAGAARYAHHWRLCPPRSPHSPLSLPAEPPYQRGFAPMAVSPPVESGLFDARNTRALMAASAPAPAHSPWSSAGSLSVLDPPLCWLLAVCPSTCLGLASFRPRVLRLKGFRGRRRPGLHMVSDFPTYHGAPESLASIPHRRRPKSSRDTTRSGPLPPIKWWIFTTLVIVIVTISIPF